MLLDDDRTGGVIYVNKQTYDQALLLHGRFDADPNRVINTIKGKGTDTYVVNFELRELVNNMMKEMPSPLNMLAPFIILATQNKNIEWNKDNLVMGYGILHQFSQLIDFNATTLVPTEVRNNLSLPTVILMQYEASWNELCSTLKDRVVTIKNDTVKNEEHMAKPKSSNEVRKEVINKEPEDDEEVEDDGIDWDALNAKLESIKNAPPEKSLSTSSTPAPEPMPVIAVNKSEAAASKSTLDEFDI